MDGNTKEKETKEVKDERYYKACKVPLKVKEERDE